MFDNVEDKIQKAAIFILSISIVGSLLLIIVGIIKRSNNDIRTEELWIYIIFAVILFVSSFINALLLYGFGELLYKVYNISAKVTSISQNLEQIEKPIKSSEWKCSCGKTNPNYTHTCVCGKSKPE